MNSVYEQVLEFKQKYPMTIGWRLKENASIVEKHLNPDEEVLYVFIAQKNDNPFNIFASAVVALTNKRILIGRKRVLIDMFNDLTVSGGLIWGKVNIDTVKEVVTLSNISNDALTEIETEITSYMMEAKKNIIEKPEEEN